MQFSSVHEIIQRLKQRVKGLFELRFYPVLFIQEQLKRVIKMNKEKQTRQDGNDGSLEDDDAMYMERIAKTALSVVKKPAGPK